jgi:drug/metabolite transporter (DMT)-like permease
MSNPAPYNIHIHVLTLLAVIAFAANSVLCRLALDGDLIDPASFSSIRLLSGALLLTLYLGINKRDKTTIQTNWWAGLALFIYVVCFSYAYVELNVSTGALILFATLQISFFVMGFIKGERPTPLCLFGLLIAAAGFGTMIVPGIQTPPLSSTLLMIVAGIAASTYSIFGKSATEPLVITAKNFIVTLPLAMGLFAWSTINAQLLTIPGVVLAVFSGAYASGIGYVLWYTILPRLTYFQASSSQFGIPLLSALAGILILGESMTLTLLVASALILLGLWMTFVSRSIKESKSIEPHH